MHSHIFPWKCQPIAHEFVYHSSTWIKFAIWWLNHDFLQHKQPLFFYNGYLRSNVAQYHAYLEPGNKPLYPISFVGSGSRPNTLPLGMLLPPTLVIRVFFQKIKENWNGDNFWNDESTCRWYYKLASKCGQFLPIFMSSWDVRGALYSIFRFRIMAIVAQKNRVSCDCNHNGHFHYYLSCSTSIVNHLCGVTNTKCKPNVICHSLL